MSTTLVKVNCILCTNTFETSFQGKNPKCKQCTKQNVKQNTVAEKEPTVIPTTNDNTATNKNMLVCVTCTVEFTSTFQGKNPKCSKCTGKKSTDVKPEPETKIETKPEPDMNKKKVTCVGCKIEFNSAFQGKNPKCISCK